MAVHFANWRCLAVASSRAWSSVPPHNQCMQHCRKTPLVQQWPPLPLPWDYNRCYHQWSSKVWLHIARVNLLKWGFGCAGICSRILCICLHWGSNRSGATKSRALQGMIIAIHAPAFHFCCTLVPYLPPFFALCAHGQLLPSCFLKGYAACQCQTNCAGLSSPAAHL